MRGRFIVIMVCSALLGLAALNGPAYSQAGSIGGTIGPPDQIEKPRAGASHPRKARTGQPRSATRNPVATGCARIVGTWNWLVVAQVTFRSDRTFQYEGPGGSRVGQWTCNDGVHFALRSKTNEDRMTMSDDGNTMTGVSSVTGFLVTFAVHKAP